MVKGVLFLSLGVDMDFFKSNYWYETRVGSGNGNDGKGNTRDLRLTLGEKSDFWKFANLYDYKNERVPEIVIEEKEVTKRKLDEEEIEPKKKKKVEKSLVEELMVAAKATKDQAESAIRTIQEVIISKCGENPTEQEITRMIKTYLKGLTLSDIHEEREFGETMRAYQRQKMQANDSDSDEK